MRYIINLYLHTYMYMHTLYIAYTLLSDIDMFEDCTEYNKILY